MEGIEIFYRMSEVSGISSLSFWVWAIFIGIFVSVFINTSASLVNLIQISLTRGFGPAAWFATGVMLNDAMVISIAILTSIKVPESPVLFCGTGILLITFGVLTFRKKVRDSNKCSEFEERAENNNQDKDEKYSWLKLLFKGFILNIMNPFNWLFWFSGVAIVSSNMSGSKIELAVFFALVLISMLMMELLKSFWASKVKKLRNPSKTSMINKIAGIVLMILGFYFFVKGII